MASRICWGLLVAWILFMAVKTVEGLAAASVLRSFYAVVGAVPPGVRSSDIVTLLAAWIVPSLVLLILALTLRKRP